MATSTVNPGFMGYASFGGSKFRFADCSFAAKQEINAPDLVTGYFRREAYNYGPVDISGTLSGPVGTNFTAAGSIWDKATLRDSCGLLTQDTIDIVYYCGTGLSFPTCKFNSITLSCAAGDVAQYSVDIIAAGAPTDATGSDFTTAEKLITWDGLTLTVTGSDGKTFNDDAFSNFEITINNNVEAVYAMISSGTNNLFPFALVEGLSTITGSVSVYNLQTNMIGADDFFGYNTGALGTISINLNGTTYAFNVKWHRFEPTAAVGPIISTVGFTGVEQQPFD
jgi:hypothetical protein